MPKDDLVYVGHMLDTARRAVQLARDKDRTAYVSDEVLRLALTHLVQVVGEAARRVSSSFAELHPEVPWKPVVGMRNKLVHDYMGVDEGMVWDTVKKELPPLIAVLEKVVA